MSERKAQAIKAIALALKDGPLETRPLLTQVLKSLGWEPKWVYPEGRPRRNINRGYLASLLQTEQGILWSKGRTAGPYNWRNIWELMR